MRKRLVWFKKRWHVNASATRKAAIAYTRQHRQRVQRLRRPLAQKQRADQFDGGGQCQPVRNDAHHTGQGIAPKKHAAQEPRWREEQRDVRGEKVVALDPRQPLSGGSGPHMRTGLVLPAPWGANYAPAFARCPLKRQRVDDRVVPAALSQRHNFKSGAGSCGYWAARLQESSP